LPLDLLPAPHPAIFFLTLLFQDAATTAIYTLSLHDALPISPSGGRPCRRKSGGDGGSPATHTARTARHTAPRSAGTAAATPAAAPSCRIPATRCRLPSPTRNRKATGRPGLHASPTAASRRQPATRWLRPTPATGDCRPKMSCPCLFPPCGPRTPCPFARPR